MSKLIDKIYKQANRATGVKEIEIDRVFFGTKEELAFLSEFIKLVDDHKEMGNQLVIAEFSIRTLLAQIDDLQNDVKASGDISMGLGDKRDPEKDRE